MSSLSHTLEQQLATRNLEPGEWRTLIQRLLDYGVLCRDDSLVEAEFYDQFIRVQDLVDDYLSLMGVRFQHDAHFQFVRIIPPGARVPGLEDESDEPFNGGFRQRLSQHEIALILVLRAEYDKNLREGLIDEQGCTAISLEAVALAMKNLLRRGLPENAVERRQVFKRLRQLRLIHYVQEADLDQTESWLKIRPLIINLVTNEWLDKIRSDLASGNALLNENADENSPDDVQSQEDAETNSQGRPSQIIGQHRDEALKKKIQRNTMKKNSEKNRSAGIDIVAKEGKNKKGKIGKGKSTKEKITTEKTLGKIGSPSIFSDNS